MQVTGTLTANDQVVGPLTVSSERSGAFQVVITGTITVTLERSLDDGANYVAVETGYTASKAGIIDGPGKFRLKASGVSGGSAACVLEV